MIIDKEKICKMPFTYCEISKNGDVTPCCPAYCNMYSFGNILENTLEEIWNSEKAKKFRQNIIDKKYTYCNFENCAAFMPSINQSINQSSIEKLAMSFDTECNVACVTCRDNIIRNTKEDEERLERLTTNIWSIMPKVQYFNLSGSGDPFGSKYARNLIKNIAEEFPHIKFNIITNGVLFTKNLYQDLKLKNRIDDIQISLHSANEKTYNKIVKYGNFKKVMKNIEWLSKEKQNGKVKNITLLFVVHKLNYKDMPAFVKMAQKYNCNAGFTHYRQWATSFKYDENAIFDPKFPEYWKFCEVMQNPIFNESCCFMDKMIDDARKVSQKDINKMKQKYYLKKIFSVYNKDNHKIFQICGIKLKFKYKKFSLKKEKQKI